MAAAAEAGFDVAVIEGAQCGTAGSPEMTINNFGLPTAYALPRAASFIDREGLKGKMSLVVVGGLRDSGDVLKALALGADAVYLGQAALAALLYSQLEKTTIAVFFTSLFSYSPEEEDDLDIDKAATGLYNYIKATGDELALAARLLGKADIREISKDDMRSLTSLIASVTGVTPAYQT
jgi:glutamate synthase domain-containing protein 2